MGIATAALIAGGVAAAAGAVAGATDKKTTSTTTTESKTSNKSTVDAGTASAGEQAATDSINSNFNTLSGYVDKGPGASDVEAGTQSSRDLASLLSQYQQSGGAPSTQDINQGRQFAGQMYAGQRIGAQQSAIQAQQQFAQAAATQGRGGLDAVFRNKVAQQQSDQEAIIGANENAFASQQAQQFSQNRLQFAGQRANVLGGLATQAMSNRQALMGMGSQIQAAERNFRLATAARSSEGTSSGTSTQENIQHGSVGGAISGGLAGFGAGMSAASGFGGGKQGGGGDVGSSANNPFVGGVRVAGPPRAPAGYGQAPAF